MNPDNKIYLTFDMDWACDEVMDFLYTLLEKFNICATVNITNDFRSLNKYRENEKIELGIHPNFNFAINGEKKDNKESIIKKCKCIIPEAVIVRSHSLLKSRLLTKAFYDYGIRYELNYFVEPYEGICIYPWLFQGVLQIPFFYEDDLYLAEGNGKNPQIYLSNKVKMYRVFNFHPIHLFLNSESLERYEKIKGNYHDFKILKENVNVESYGILDFFKELVEDAKIKGYQFETITSIDLI